jgi:bloom syndrome protein
MSDDETDDDDAFEPVRMAGSSRKPTAKELGPPITSDAAMANLNDVHRSLVENFVHEAEPMCKEIMKKKDLRYQPFTNTILREMAIRFTDTEAKMLQIRGIDPEKVKLHGKPFMALAARYYKNYREMGGVDAENDDDGEPLEYVDKHAQNVIDLVSDEEEDEEDEEDFGSMPSDGEDDGEQSSYFQTAPEVAAFNARLSQAQSLAAKNIAASQSASKSSPKRRKKSGHYAVKARKTKASTPALDGFRYSGEGASTAAKRAPRRPKTGARGSSASASRRGSGARGGQGRRTISMMPT